MRQHRMRRSQFSENSRVNVVKFFPSGGIPQRLNQTNLIVGILRYQGQGHTLIKVIV